MIYVTSLAMAFAFGVADYCNNLMTTFNKPTAGNFNDQLSFIHLLLQITLPAQLICCALNVFLGDPFW